MSDHPTLDQWRHWDAEIDRDELNEQGCLAFLTVHGELSLENARRVAAWCEERDVPTTLKNLEIAHRYLAERGQLESAPPTEESRQQPIVTHPMEAAGVAPPTDEEARQLDKLRDDPLLSDHARKQRDEKLRRLYVASRNARRTFPSYAEPQILV